MFDIDPIDGQVTVDDYVDVLGVCLRDWLSPAELGYLKAHCVELRLRRYPLWMPAYCLSVRLFQPDQQAIEFIAEKGDRVRMTYLEIARDEIKTVEEQVQAWLDLTYGHLIQLRHGKRRQRRWENGNWRSADLSRVVYRHGKKVKQRSVGMVFQAYGDRPSKRTGELNCCHLEAKVYGSAALRRVGLNHVRDLLNFDFNAFWSSNHPPVVTVDRERLGRWWENRRTKSRRRTPIITRHGYNVDRAVGNLLCRIYGRDKHGNHSIQLLIDNVGRGPWIIRYDRSPHRQRGLGYQGLAVGTCLVSDNINQ